MTSIVRRVDDLGRVVIPLEIRRKLNIYEGSPLEISVDSNKVIFQKYQSSLATEMRDLSDRIEETFNGTEVDSGDILAALNIAIRQLEKAEEEL